MKRIVINSLLAVGLLAAQVPAGAEDIDLFTQPAQSTTDLPNVLILVDNTANWNTAFTNEIAALSSTINGLPADKFRVGLMLFTETGSGNSNVDGGYVRAAVRQLSASNKTKYQALVNSLDKLGDKSNGGKAGVTMEEAYRYFAGLAPRSGNNKVKTDYTGNTSGAAASNAIYALAGNAINSFAGTPYNSPIISGSCAKNFIIYISNGPAQDNQSDTTTATNDLNTLATAVGISNATTPIQISPSLSPANEGDEWARFMHMTTQAIVTYTVDVNPGTTGQGPGWTALLKSMANVSTGKYFSVNSSTGSGSQISDALNKIFSEIQSVNSVFASVSLPVSVNTQGTYLNQVFIGMFRPDPNAMPRWPGNLKQYKLGFVGTNLKLVDADNNDAINSSTGFITECARSYWTPTTLDTYWAFNPMGGCLSVANSNSSNYPDGNIVEKGAQGYMLRGLAPTSRTVYTCSGTSFSSCTSLIGFNNTNVTQSMLGASSTTERDQLINWEIGQDIDDENINGTTTTEMRPSVHADVVHSRPLAIDYGTSTSPQVVVYYGTNDGELHAINGNQSASIGSFSPGSELWSFVAPESYSNIKRLRDNTVPIKYFGSTNASALPKPYGIDGPIAGYKDSTHAWIFPSMRRGGRVLYAFDVTNPQSPSLKWKIGCPNNFPTSGTVNDTGCTSGMSGLGQTWSTPKVIKASGYGSGNSPMLMMGGGYDTCEDSDPNTCTSSTKGNHIYVLDADTGALLKSLPTDRAVAGDVFVVNDSGTGKAMYAYAADLGGNVYRISGVDANSPFSTTAPDSWTITKIASLGCSTPTTCTANRKFMFGPDVISPSTGVYDLLLGSGDREKPLLGYTSAASVQNYFFMLEDSPAAPTWLSNEAANCGGNSLLCLNSLLEISSSTPSQSALTTKKGWYLDLGLSSTGGSEQVVTSAITVYGIVTFSTQQPAVVTTGECGSNLGTTRVYNVSYINAAGVATTTNPNASRYQVVAGGGLPPSPVAGMVTLTVGGSNVSGGGEGESGGTSVTVPFVIGGSPESPIQSNNPTPTGSFSQPKGRIYWYIQP